MIYLDSSALVKLVVEEPESAALREELRRDPDQVVSAIAEVEVIRAVRRLAPDLVGHALAVMAQIAVVEVDEAIRTEAALLEPPLLRSLDALHLATARRIGAHLRALVTYDTRMAAGAGGAGIRVLAPV